VGGLLVSKAGLIALSKTLLKEREGIRVAAIWTGAVNTEFWDTEIVHLWVWALSNVNPEIVAHRFCRVVPEQALRIGLMPSAGVLQGVDTFI